MAFYSRKAKDINVARLNHFKRQGYNLTDKVVVETGCGPVGYFTDYLLSQNPRKLLCIDGRAEHIKVMQEKYKGVKNIEFMVADLNKPDKKVFEDCDFCFCVGTLYHLEDPATFLECVGMSKELYLSTRVGCVKDDICYAEEPNDIDQSITGVGCRPHSRWIKRVLRSMYTNVETLRPPKHIEFGHSEKLGGPRRKVYYARQRIR